MNMEIDLKEVSYDNLAYADETESSNTNSETREIDSNKLPTRETENKEHLDLNTDHQHAEEKVINDDKLDDGRNNLKLVTVNVELKHKRDINQERTISTDDKNKIENRLSYTLSEITNVIQRALPENGKNVNRIDQSASAEQVAVTAGVSEQLASGQAIRDNENVSNDNINEDKNGNIKQCCSDKVFIAKVIRTIFVLWSYTIFGWTFGIAGPTLPDLQLISGANLQLASWMFTAFNIGYLVACAASGFVHRKVHPDILLFLYNAGQALTVGVLPLLSSIYVMIALRVIQGYCTGGMDTELSLMIFSVWHSDGGPIFQMTHFVFGIGGILSPIVAEPFMIKDIPYARTDNNISSAISHEPINDSVSLTRCNQEGLDENMTLTPFCARTVTVVKETNIQFAYLISAVLVFSAAVPFLIYYVTGNRTVQGQDSEVSGNRKQLSGKVQALVIVLLCFISAIGTGLVDSFPSFLATFGLLQLNWSQATGSMMTALYFAMYAVGNLLGVFILKCISSRSFIYFTYISSVGSILLLYICVHWELVPLQIPTVAMIGLTTSAIMPTIFTWTQDAVTPISGFIASAFLFSGSVGAMVNPVIMGYLMESITPMWFLYLDIAEVLCCFAIFIGAALMTRKCLIPTLYEIQIRKSNSVVTKSPDDKDQQFQHHNNSGYHSKGTLIFF